MRVLKYISLLFIFICFSCSRAERIPNTSYSYLALGDSYTIGTGIDAKENWPNQLSDSLTTRNFTIDTTTIIATNGWATADLKKGIKQEKLSQTFDLVSLLIGVNNQYQKLDIETYKTDFRELLEQAISFADEDTNKVFVVSIPNYGVTPFAQSRSPDTIKKEIELYNEIAKNISAEYRISFINITPISEMVGNDSTLVASDGLHPSAKMYALWIKQMLPLVTTKIGG